ncbi:glycogen debranching protein GlgX [Algirhabdus cladophorae]|uniref:glycogen debranching protein GlgX n=1 Tax=Algirhabdus cladophorae TaxID=3377108 RepID=UPI003B848443
MTYHSTVSLDLEAGNPHQLGAHFDGNGVNFAVFSQHGEQVFLCLFSTDGTVEECRIPLPERTGSVWHGYVPGLQPGALYGYRVAGAFDPTKGHRFNLNKLLIDPYARAFQGEFSTHSATYAYQFNDPNADLSFDTRDSAAHVPKSVVSTPDDFAPDAQNLQRGWDNTLIYEAHVKGLTIQHPDVPMPLRGTFDGLAHPAILDHLHRLGITSIELLPVQAIKSEAALSTRGLSNYWGYNTVGFFAPEPRYFGPNGVQGFRKMVQAYHDAGIEVILDVVYNHSAEGDHLGPTLSFRGLDNLSYYRLQDENRRYYVNDTGCGNTLDFSHPFVIRMVLDSLRFWVQVMGVDGFRFDLATVLCREKHGFDRRSGFLDALRQDPILSGIKLIAEPWDIGPGGYQLGSFPSEFAEWNDRYRDTLRQFWRGDAHSAQGLGSALLGSAGVFDHRGRRVWSSINYAASHDGFTLADTTQYLNRHNQANGEQNQDGHRANHSDNFGVEGPSDDPDIKRKRAQRQRNLLASVMVSQGTPMLLAGDEGGHSQGGNNNTYCQDNAISWLNWQDFDTDLVDFTAALSTFRRSHPVLAQMDFLHGAIRTSDLKPDVEWRGFSGGALDWKNPDLAQICLHLRGTAENQIGNGLKDEVILAFNRTDTDAELTLSDLEQGTWVCEINTAKAFQTPSHITASTALIPAQSLCAFCPLDHTAK